MSSKTFGALAVVVAVTVGLVLSGCGKKYKKAEEITQADFMEFLASSEREGGAGAAENAFDGDPSTRWESEWQTDPSWVAIGLKKKSSISSLSIKWEAAAATVYKIEVSDNGNRWKTVATVENGQGEEERVITLDKPVAAKYLRIFGEQRTLQEYGYSIWEVKLNPTSAAASTGKSSKVSIVSAEASSAGGSGGADMAIDGDTNTRWESEHGVDPSWITAELQDVTSVSAVKIKWEAASGKVYKIQVSRDNDTWKDVAEVTDGQPDEERTVTFKPTKAKYVRILGEERNGEWGYSIWEFSVYK